VNYIESFDTSGLSIKIAGEVKHFDVLPFLGEHRKNLKLMSRAVRFGVGAAALAVEDAALDTSRLDPGRFGVCMGAGIVPLDVGELVSPIIRSVGKDGTFDMGRFTLARAESIFPLWLLQHLPNMAAAHISILQHAMGPNNTIVTACAAGTQAVGEAFRLIARGDADVMLAGGCDSRLDPQLCVAYSAMKALSASNRPPREVSRPFDFERDGFVLGEGAAVLVLEAYRRAKRRGAPIYAEITGYGSSFDAFGITRPEPEGKGAVLSMSAALREARLDPTDVDYINAHGTSTRLNDLMETVAVKRLFGHRASSIPMSSQKSMIGHLIGASGAVEAAATALSLQRGVVPPTINLATPDPECDLDYVPNTSRELPVATALSNSFGFGGQNASLVMARI
jgi:3-oxoacyl-[acyl-carrier-protein] synthase II